MDYSQKSRLFTTFYKYCLLFVYLVLASQNYIMQIVFWKPNLSLGLYMSKRDMSFEKVHNWLLVLRDSAR